MHLAADNVNELKDWMDTIKESAKPGFHFSLVVSHSFQLK